MTSRRRAFLLAALSLACFACEHDPGPGQVAPRDPVQVDATTPQASFRREGFDITPLATLDIEARVLSVETYRHDRGAKLAPTDLALGWGPMSDSAVLRHLEIDQGFRLFTWKCREFPIPREEIEAHASNVHVIPSSDAIEDRIDSLRVGDVVRLEGVLVEARGPNGFIWRSSLTRQDTAVGACELIWVERVSVR